MLHAPQPAHLVEHLRVMAEEMVVLVVLDLLRALLLLVALVELVGTLEMGVKAAMQVHRESRVTVVQGAAQAAAAEIPILQDVTWAGAAAVAVVLAY
jgi:hypothetical protein